MTYHKSISMFYIFILFFAQSCAKNNESKEYKINEVIDLNKLYIKNNKQNHRYKYNLCNDILIQWDSIAIVSPYTDSNLTERALKVNLSRNLRKAIANQKYSDDYYLLLFFHRGSIPVYVKSNSYPIDFRTLIVNTNIGWLTKRNCTSIVTEKEIYNAKTIYHLKLTNP